VLCIVTRRIVALSPESLDECIARPPLESEGTGLDALDQWRTRNERFVGLADVVVGLFNTAVEDGAGLPFVFATIILLARLRRV
jgi:hypothetical protein